MVIGDEMWFTGKSSAGVYAIGYAQGDQSGVIPEPSTLIIWSLLGALAITVGWRRKRRRG